MSTPPKASFVARTKLDAAATYLRIAQWVLLGILSSVYFSLSWAMEDINPILISVEFSFFFLGLLFGLLSLWFLYRLKRSKRLFLRIKAGLKLVLIGSLFDLVAAVLLLVATYVFPSGVDFVDSSSRGLGWCLCALGLLLLSYEFFHQGWMHENSHLYMKVDEFEEVEVKSPQKPYVGTNKRISEKASPKPSKELVKADAHKENADPNVIDVDATFKD